MRRLLAGPGDVRSLRGPRLCAVAPGTAERLAHWGIKVDLRPAEFRADAILEAIRALGPIDGRRFLLPRADIPLDVLAGELRLAGAQVTEVVAYRRVQEPLLREDGSHDLYRMLLDRQIDVVLFTSASTVHNLASSLGEEQAADLLRGTTVACIGPVTAAAARDLDIEPAVVATDYSIAGLVQAVVDHYAAARPGER